MYIWSYWVEKRAMSQTTHMDGCMALISSWSWIKASARAKVSSAGSYNSEE